MKIHGPVSLHPLHKIWAGIKSRCLNPNHPGYRRYGGRGIKICDAWRLNFVQFVKDVGPRAPGTSLDRYPDPDGNYEPGNVRWATPAQQAPTKRFITYRGETKQLSEWATEKGLSRYCVHQRLELGWAVERALETPKRRYSRTGIYPHPGKRLELNAERA